MAEFPFTPKGLTPNFLQLQTPRRGDGARPQSIQMYVFYAPREKADLVERLLGQVFDGGADPVTFPNTYNWVVKGSILSTTRPAAFEAIVAEQAAEYADRAMFSVEGVPPEIDLTRHVA